MMLPSNYVDALRMLFAQKGMSIFTDTQKTRICTDALHVYSNLYAVEFIWL